MSRKLEPPVAPMAREAHSKLMDVTQSHVCVTGLLSGIIVYAQLKLVNRLFIIGNITVIKMVKWEKEG